MSTSIKESQKGVDLFAAGLTRIRSLPTGACRAIPADVAAIGSAARDTRFATSADSTLFRPRPDGRSCACLAQSRRLVTTFRLPACFCLHTAIVCATKHDSRQFIWLKPCIFCPSPDFGPQGASSCAPMQLLM
jgi:hypothetical protein